MYLASDLNKKKKRVLPPCSPVVPTCLYSVYSYTAVTLRLLAWGYFTASYSTKLFAGCWPNLNFGRHGPCQPRPIHARRTDSSSFETCWASDCLFFPWVLGLCSVYIWCFFCLFLCWFIVCHISFWGARHSFCFFFFDFFLFGSFDFSFIEGVCRACRIQYDAMCVFFALQCLHVYSTYHCITMYCSISVA